MARPVQPPRNGMPHVELHYHLLTPEGRAEMNRLRENHAHQEGVSMDRVRWRQRKGKAWLYIAPQ